ncbi:MAG TPA: DUF6776 family protein [Xanthomonadaceae bacterium]|nr:DUF6776 family protein [Lysobacter sp. M2-1]HEX5664360.1 DUF6776 family protein [Xanthomonadaceae bacterium]
MNEPSPPPEAVGKPAPERHQGHGLAYTVIAVFLLALVFGAWGLWKVFAPAPGDASAQLEEQRERIAALEQNVANLTRSDQISRNANTALQGTLAERDEEIAGLRADVAFYERFVGATGQRRGLTVHALSLKPQDAQAWHFVATLTQNLNRGAINQGRATLSVEGTRDGRMQQLDWSSLRQQPDAPGVDYSFKYFQRVEGDVLLPPGFKPVRVIVRLQPKGGTAVERSFTWADATGAQAPGQQ